MSNDARNLMLETGPVETANIAVEKIHGIPEAANHFAHGSRRGEHYQLLLLGHSLYIHRGGNCYQMQLDDAFNEIIDTCDVLEVPDELAEAFLVNMRGRDAEVERGELGEWICPADCEPEPMQHYQLTISIRGARSVIRTAVYLGPDDSLPRIPAATDRSRWLELRGCEGVPLPDCIIVAYRQPNPTPYWSEA